MFGFTLLKSLLIIWSVITGIGLLLLIYRSTLGSHEENQLFLGRNGGVLEEEQKEVYKKEKKVAPLLYFFGGASGVLLIAIVCVWLYRGLLMT